MKTFSYLLRSIACKILSKSFPAFPIKGIPSLSSSSPGASPTSIRSAFGSPDPKTKFFLVVDN